MDEPLLSGANRKWDNAHTLRYGGGVMHSSIHFDLTANLIVQLHGKREMFLLHPGCDIPTEENKHKVILDNCAPDSTCLVSSNDSCE